MSDGPRVERRLVHVLFADLVGFTGLAESLDAEDVALVQDRYFGRVDAAVEAGGGQVEKYIGDAVVAVFGLPTLHADDARRAVETGLAVVASIAELERELGAAEGSLRVRVGVHTGEVVVTWSGDGRTWRLSGDVVNTAARLQAAATPGTVVVGPDTALAVAPALVLEDLGELALKGRSAPVSARRVVGRVAGPPARDTPLPFRGRDRELAALDAARDGAGDARLLLLLAPPGVGRSRLVHEWRARLHAGGVPAWAVTVRVDGGGYAPVADLLRQALAVTGTDEHAVAARLEERGLGGPRAAVGARHVTALLAGDPGAAGAADPVDLWTSWVAVLDAHGPVEGPAPVWILDDLHLAGPDLRAFVDHAVGHAHRHDRLVVATARPGRELPAGGVVTTLDPLGAEVVRRIVEDGLAGSGEREPGLVEEIVRAAGGNPLFVAELVRARRLEGTPGTSAAARVPSTVAAIYLEQLDDLPVPSRGLLEAGSVAGTTVPARALPSLGVADVAGPLRDLTGVGLLVGPHDDAVDPLSYTYRHALLRDAAYGTLPRARRASLHLRYADWLDADRTDHRAEQVGLHLAAAWEQAPALGGPVDGVLARDDLAARAAERLARAGEVRFATEPHRAAELFARAVELGDPAPSPRRAHRLLRAAQAWRRAGRLPEAMEAFAGVAAAGPDDGRDAAVAALGYEDALFESRLPREAWPRVAALLDDALASTPSEEVVLGSRLLAARARGRIYGGDPGERAAGERVAREALALARYAGDDAAAAYALLALRGALGDPERLGDRLAVDEQMLVAAVGAGDAEREFEARRLCFVDRLEAGEVATAETMRRAAQDLAVALGHGGHLWYPPMWRAATALFRGELASAAALVEDFRREAERWHYRDADQVHAVQLLTLHHELGTPDRALPALAAVAARAAPRTRLHLGVGLVRAGRVAEAREHLVALRPDGFAGVGSDGARTFLLAEAAEIADAVGDADAGAELHALLAPAHGHLVVVGSGALCLGAVAHFRGLAARAAGDRALAAAHLDEAATRNDDAGAHRCAARSRRELERT